MLAPQKESIFSRSCRLWLLSWRRARVFARSCSLLSKYLPISWKQRKEQSHAQCHVTHRIRIFDKISEHVKVAKSVDIAVPELAVTFPAFVYLPICCGGITMKIEFTMCRLGTIIFCPIRLFSAPIFECLPLVFGKTTATFGKIVFNRIVFYKYFKQ